MTEVSDLSTDNALTLTVPGSTQTLTIPSISTRRADTTVEIPSGGSLALAGMIQEKTKQQINGIPGLMQLPILGALFKSRDYINNQTELMVIVTPYVVRAVAQKQLSRPDDGYADPNDPQAALLGRINRITAPPHRRRCRPTRRTATAANTASSSIERDQETTDETTSHGDCARGAQAALRLLAAGGLALMLAGCYDKTTGVAQPNTRPTTGCAIRSR